jgi:ketosteroid isomerase-like protein
MLRVALFLLLLGSGFPSPAEEIPLETCDLLPVVQVRISGMKFLFLVDTAATSMLNAKSFVHGDPRRVTITSWSGTVATSGRQIMLADLAIGRHHFKDIKLPAIDLSAIGQGCGRSIDGILGIDLLEKLGAKVDLNGPSARLLMEPENMQARVEELESQLAACGQAFNRADEKAFGECLDPQIVMFTANGDYYGREAVTQYLRSRYFQQQPPARLTFTTRAHHVVGDAIWMEYDLQISIGQQELIARGTAVCQKENGKWRFVHMNHSSPPTH